MGSFFSINLFLFSVVILLIRHILCRFVSLLSVIRFTTLCVLQIIIAHCLSLFISAITRLSLFARCRINELLLTRHRGCLSFILVFRLICLTSSHRLGDRSLLSHLYFTMVVVVKTKLTSILLLVNNAHVLVCSSTSATIVLSTNSLANSYTTIRIESSSS